MSVTVSLNRPTGADTSRQVASATASTNASGDWSATLSPADAFGSPYDVLTTTYATGTAPGATTLPSNESFSESDNVAFEGKLSSISGSGSLISNQSASCPGLSFVIDGAPHATTANLTTGACEFAPTPAVTNDNHVQAMYTQSLQDLSGSTYAVTTIDDVGLVGTGPAGPPKCSGDLVFGQVTCSDLSSAGFTVSRNGGAPVALATFRDSPTSLTYTGTATLTGLAAGDLLTLKQSGGTRALTTLHVYVLRVDVDPFGAMSGSCQPDKDIVNGFVCPTSGTMTPDMGGTSEFDDLSGGSTLVNEPVLSDQVPAFDDSMPGGLWTGYADVYGNGNTAQTLAVLQSVDFQVIPHGEGAPVFNANATPGSDSLGAFESVTLTGPLAAGRYFAEWLLTDTHGDTAAYTDTFVQQPGGGPGPQGPQGGHRSDGQPVHETAVTRAGSDRVRGAPAGAPRPPS